MKNKEIIEALKNLDGIVACGIIDEKGNIYECCLLYTSPSPRD